MANCSDPDQTVLSTIFVSYNKGTISLSQTTPNIKISPVTVQPVTSKYLWDNRKSLLKTDACIAVLHSDRPKLYSAVGL